MTSNYCYTFQAKFVGYRRITVNADNTQDAMDMAVDADPEDWEPIDTPEMQHPLYWDHNDMMVDHREDPYSIN